MLSRGVISRPTAQKVPIGEPPMKPLDAVAAFFFAVTPIAAFAGDFKPLIAQLARALQRHQYNDGLS
jgi:hypothetical protein